jgi:hypothetical protein
MRSAKLERSADDVRRRSGAAVFEDRPRAPVRVAEDRREWHGGGVHRVAHFIGAAPQQQQVALLEGHRLRSVGTAQPAASPLDQVKVRELPCADAKRPRRGQDRATENPASELHRIQHVREDVGASRFADSSH